MPLIQEKANEKKTKYAKNEEETQKDNADKCTKKRKEKQNFKKHVSTS